MITFASSALRLASVIAIGLLTVTSALAEQVFTEDVTIRDLGPVLKFDDSRSTDADWRICVDSESGCAGDQDFAINWDDTLPSGSARPFVIENGAKTNQLYLDDTGKVGIGTNVPGADLTVAGGGDIQLKDSFGDWVLEAFSESITFNGIPIVTKSFSIASSGKRPFRVFSGAPDNSLSIGVTGRIGMGTSSPEAQLHVAGSTPEARVQYTGSTAAERNLFTLKNKGTANFEISTGDATANKWSFGVLNNNFRINAVGTGRVEVGVDREGNLTTFGKVNCGKGCFNTSSRKLKTDFALVDEEEVLEKLAKMPLRTWRYKSDSNEPMHIGPVAEEFQEAFGFSDGNVISTVDADGVTMAAVKGLNRKLAALQGLHEEAVEQRDGEIAALKARNEALEERLARLESRIQ